MNFKIYKYFRVIINIIIFTGMASLINAQTSVTVDNTSSGYSVTGNTVTISHTTGTGSNRLLLVGISTRDRTVSSVTYDGDALEFVGSELNNSDAYTYIYHLSSPPSGTFSLVVTFTSNLGNNNAGIVGAMTFENVNQTTPLGTFASTSGNNATPLLSVSSATDQLVFNVLAMKNQTINFPVSPQIQRWNFDPGGSSLGAGCTKAGGAPSVNLSWNVAGSDRWSMSGISIVPVSDSDLSISKTVNNSKPFRGQNIVFTLLASNIGPDIANKVIVSDLLPSGYSLVSYSASVGTYNGGSGEWEIGDINSGSSCTLTITAFVMESGIYNNSANITGDVIDIVNTNNTSTIGITICQAGSVKPLFSN